MPTNPIAPHKALCLINIKINEVLPTGECAAKLVGEDELKQYNLKHKMVVSITGQNMQDCLLKLQKAIEGFK
jgi:hypothetical protein